jgi:hypothetical protein
MHRTKKNVMVYAVNFHACVGKIQSWFRIRRAKKLFRSKLHEMRVRQESRISGRLLYEKSVFYTIYDEVSYINRYCLKNPNCNIAAWCSCGS